jgi:hypothetical protein
MQRHTVRTVRESLLLLALAITILSASTSYAIPAFSRMYGTSCNTCHVDFPKLNDFGKAFKDAGFKSMTTIRSSRGTWTRSSKAPLG